MVGKAILEFDLTDNDQKLSHLRAVMADKLFFAIHEYRNVLRNYGKGDLTDDEYKAFEHLQSRFYQCVNEETIHLMDML